jgi:hypothetical protein
MGESLLDDHNYTDLPKKVVNNGGKKGNKKTTFLLISIVFLLAGLIITSLIVLKLKEREPVKPPKPKAVCPWYAPRHQCPSNWHWEESDCFNAEDGSKNCCCTESRPPPTAPPDRCRIIYDDNKCFTVSGQDCAGKPLSSFRKPYSGTTQTNDRSTCSTTNNHQSEGTVPDAGSHTYCANAQPGECVQFDHDFEGIGPNDEIVNGGGVCECEPPASTPTPVETSTPIPTVPLTPTDVPDDTPTPIDTPTVTPTVTLTPTGTPPATDTPGQPTNTLTPTEIIIAQTSETPTVVAAVPSAGKPATWLIAIPAIILLLGILL